MRNRWALVIVGLTSVAYAAPVRKVRVEKRELRDVFKVEATLAPRELAALASPTAGIVQEVLVDAATVVKKGQKLVSIAAIKGGKPTGVVAPFDGVVIARAAVVGVFVTEGASLFTVASDLSALRAELDVPETLAPRLKIGTTINLAFEAYPDRVYQATLGRCVPWVDVRTRTRHCDGDLANLERTLVPGMSGVATWVAAQHTGLAVPSVAVVREADRPFVLRVAGGNAVKVPVTLGIVDGDVVEVLSGVAENDELVVGVKEGQKVD